MILGGDDMSINVHYMEKRQNGHGHLWTFMDIYGHLWTFSNVRKLPQTHICLLNTND